jgi:centromere protein C
MMDPKPTKNHAYKFQRIFTDADFMAAGILVIPANEAKPLKPARDNTYVRGCELVLATYFQR